MTEIANLGPIDEPLINQVMKEFVAQAQHWVRVPQGGVEVAKDLLAQALGQHRQGRGADLQDRRAHPSGAHFRALTALDSAVAASVLSREHPQTIALVISKLPPDRGLAMLRELPEELRGDVAYRIATLSPPSPEAIRAVETGLERRIVSAAASQRLRADSDPVKPLVEILVRADAETERGILEPDGRDRPPAGPGHPPTAVHHRRPRKARGQGPPTAAAPGGHQRTGPGA